MGKKRGNVADGVKTVYQVHETPEAIQSLRQSKIRQFFFEAIGAFAMIAISLAFVYGLFWLADWRPVWHSLNRGEPYSRYCAGPGSTQRVILLAYGFAWTARPMTASPRSPSPSPRWNDPPFLCSADTGGRSTTGDRS